MPRLGDGDEVESPGGKSRVLRGTLDGGDVRERPAQLLQHVCGRVHRHRVQAASGQQRRELARSGTEVRGILGAGGNQPVGGIAGVARADAFVVFPAVPEALPELLAAFLMQFGATARHVRSPSAGPDGYLSNLPHAAGAAAPHRRVSPGCRGPRPRCRACWVPSAGRCGCRWTGPSVPRPPHSPSPGRSGVAAGVR